MIQLNMDRLSLSTKQWTNITKARQTNRQINQQINGKKDGQAEK